MNTRIIVIAFLGILLACGGSQNTPNNTVANIDTPITPPTTKTVGTFRALKGSATATANVSGVKMASSNRSATMAITRQYHKSILMKNGKVLIVGGNLDGFDPMGGLDTQQPHLPGQIIEIFDPVTETFSVSNAEAPLCIGAFQGARGVDYPSLGWTPVAMCNLPDGRVLIAQQLWAFYYNPDSDTVSDKFRIPEGAVGAIFPVGNNHVILITENAAAWDLDLSIDGATNTESWGAISPQATLNGQSKDITLRQKHSIIQSEDGHIWIFGGWQSMDFPIGPLSDVWELNPEKINWVMHEVIDGDKKYRYREGSSDGWTLHNSLSEPRYGMSALLLPGNKVGLYGGKNKDYKPTKLVEILDLETKKSTKGVDLIGLRQDMAGVYLQNGYSLLTGGQDIEDGIVNTEMIYRDSDNFTGNTGTMLEPRSRHNACHLGNGLILISGGYNENPKSSAEIYDPTLTLHIEYTCDTLVVNSSQQLSCAYGDGVTWSVQNGPGIITQDGILTATDTGIVEVLATAKNDTSLVALVMFKTIAE